MFSWNASRAQNYDYIDSLKACFKKPMSDSNTVNTYYELFWEYYGVFNDTSLQYANRIISYSKSHKFKPGLVDGYMLSGTAYSKLSNYTQALKDQQRALHICEKLPKQESDAVMNTRAKILNNIANIYTEIKDYKTALTYQQRALDLCNKMKLLQGVAACLGNMGNIYKNLGQTNAALNYYQKSLDIDIKLKNGRGISNSLSNMGVLSQKQKQYAQAEDYFKRSLRVRDSLGLTDGIAGSYINLGDLYLDLNQVDRAFDYFQRALSLAEENGSLEQQESCYDGMYQCYKKQGKIQEALSAFEKNIMLRDSIMSSGAQDELNQLKTKYLLEQRETEQKVQQAKKIAAIEAKKDAEKDAVKKQNRIILISSLIGVGLMVIFSVLIYKRYQQSLKQQKIIADQKKLVEVKNKEITDSINYAKRIQEAMLTSEQEFTKNFKKAFVLFRPKDIVSGDFYWVIEEPGTNTVLFVLGDCTGHGVPGGFMSVLGINLMNEIVNEKRVYQPAQILNLLRDRIKTALKQDGAEGTSRDGMDITIGKLNRDTNQFTYATANRMLYIYKENKLVRFTGNKMPVGYFEQEVEFVQYEVQLQKGNYIYFFTDGYVDQIGGDLGRKLKYPNFEAALKKAVEEGYPLDKKFFDQVFIDWKKHHHQVDDVSLVGIEV
jgi:serine phosphatase RsbU (regulator of sigma subunit)